MISTANYQGHTAQPTRRRLFRDLDRPHVLGQLTQNVTPNWFASVMGIGITANAAASLPLQFPGLRGFATVVWALNALWLIALSTLTLIHWLRHREQAAGYLTHPVFAQFFGAVSMGILTVSSGTLLVGIDVLGEAPALWIAAALWVVGTVIGVASAVWVPYAMINRMELDPDSAFGGWLMPVVAPMVSAASGAVLIPHLTSETLRYNLLLLCYVFFGMTLLAALPLITMIWSKAIHHGPGPAAMIPTMWIVLGPLGQSSTTIQLLGHQAPALLPIPFGEVFAAAGLIYALPVMGFALLWMLVAALTTVRAARQKLPFSLTWWSFTFPVGTCVTGLSGLSTNTGALLFSASAVILYAILLLTVVVVASRTFHGAVISGRLLAG